MRRRILAFSAITLTELLIATTIVGIIMMGIFIFKIRSAFEGIEVDNMTVLKG